MSYELREISYSYGRRKVALNRTSLILTPGTTLGVLGPNGSGKSTLLKLIATALSATAGRLLWQGEDLVHAKQLRSFRSRLGFAPQGNMLPNHLTPREAVRYALWLKGKQVQVASRNAVERALDLVSMPFNYRDMQFRKLSGGYQRRTVLACSLVHDPQVLVLDEPTAGLDQQVSAALRESLKGVRSDRIVVIATHIEDDVSELCDRAIALSDGIIVADEPASELSRRPAVIRRMTLGKGSQD